VLHKPTAATQRCSGLWATKHAVPALTATGEERGVEKGVGRERGREGGEGFRKEAPSLDLPPCPGVEGVSLCTGGEGSMCLRGLQSMQGKPCVGANGKVQELRMAARGWQEGWQVGWEEG